METAIFRCFSSISELTRDLNAIESLRCSMLPASLMTWKPFWLEKLICRGSSGKFKTIK